jgi:hypothetical protein
LICMCSCVCAHICICYAHEWLVIINNNNTNNNILFFSESIFDVTAKGLTRGEIVNNKCMGLSIYILLLFFFFYLFSQIL